MPNWCYNSLTLHNEDSSKIDKLEEALQNEDDGGLFNYFLPMPEELRNTTSPSEDGNDWYNWSINNWGTKWDVRPDFERDKNTMYLSFDSAWGPPISLYEYLFEQGWIVDALYHEPGMQFVGMFQEGIDDYNEYNFGNEDWRDLPEELIDFGNLKSDYDWYLENKEDE